MGNNDIIVNKTFISTHTDVYFLFYCFSKFIKVGGVISHTTKAK